MEVESHLTRRDFLRLSGGVAAASFLAIGGVGLNEEVNRNVPISNVENRSYYWTLDAPPSLMLHSKDFKLLQQLIPDLKARFAPTTYREWLKIYRQKKQFSDANPHPYYLDRAHLRLIRSSDILSTSIPPLVISIDDVGTSWIRREHLQIIEDLRNANMPSVIGLQPNLESGDGGQYWDLIRQLHQEGWEIASHTINHYNLPKLSQEQLRSELEQSAQRIEEGIGEAPLTLIVPFGDIYPGGGYQDMDERIFTTAEEAGYKIVVGIGAGRKIDEGPPYYFGRVVPDINPTVTLQRLVNFNSL